MVSSCRNQKYAELSAQATPTTAPVNMNGKKSKVTATPNPAQPIVHTGQVAPGSCRLVGEVVAILPQLEPDRTTPCGKVPCKAQVKVRKVVAYGAAFKTPLSEGQEISVYFPFTLSPTSAYFPGLTPPLPGLKVGSLFVADVKNTGEDSGNTPAWYQVYSYSVK